MAMVLRRTLRANRCVTMLGLPIPSRLPMGKEITPGSFKPAASRLLKEITVKPLLPPPRKSADPKLPLPPPPLSADPKLSPPPISADPKPPGSMKRPPPFSVFSLQSFKIFVFKFFMGELKSFMKKKLKHLGRYLLTVVSGWVWWGGWMNMKNSGQDKELLNDALQRALDEKEKLAADSVHEELKEVIWEIKKTRVICGVIIMLASLVIGLAWGGGGRRHPHPHSLDF